MNFEPAYGLCFGGRDAEHGWMGIKQPGEYPSDVTDARAGYNRAKRRKESKVHIDTLGHLLALTVTPADQGDRDQAVCSD
jgi:hypothetical protein